MGVARLPFWVDMVPGELLNMCTFILDMSANRGVSRNESVGSNDGVAGVSGVSSLDRELSGKLPYTVRFRVSKLYTGMV